MQTPHVGRPRNYSGVALRFSLPEPRHSYPERVLISLILLPLGNPN